MSKDLEDVRTFYGQTIQSCSDFKVTSCPVKCDSISKEIKEATAMIHKEITERNYGCGLIAPTYLNGLHVLDLGCGAGMDCYILSKLVGPHGIVTGIDMTTELLYIAEKYREYHQQQFGYKTANVTFLKGVIEDLKSAGIPNQSQDLVISNCVISLSRDKKAVLREAYRVLKDGGELYFSDMYSNKEIPSELIGDKEMWGEGLTGALFWKDLYKTAQEIGFSVPLLVDETSRMTIHDETMKNVVGAYGLDYVSATFRLFKCITTDLPEHDEGMLITATYDGKIPVYEDKFVLAKNIIFLKNIPTIIDKEIQAILLQSRFHPFFKVAEHSLVSNPFDHVEEL